jgi:hypothetical protein
MRMNIQYGPISKHDVDGRRVHTVNFHLCKDQKQRKWIFDVKSEGNSGKRL